MFSDIVGYTSQMGKDEKKAFDVLKKNRRIHWRLIKKYKGKLLKEMGDGILASFSSNIDAVMCALSIQNATKELKIPLRIGIHLGDVIFEDKDILGDGVNVASRIQSSAETHGIVISETVYNDIKNKEGLEIEFLTKQKLKGVESEIGIYKVDCHDSGVLDFTVDTGELIKPIRLGAKLFIAGFLIITVLAIALYFILKEIAPPYPELEKSIAVMAFVNDSPDQENEYFCNGMWRETHNKLVLIKDLSVRSQASVEQFRGTTVDMPTIGEELNVSYVLQASVSKYGDEFRIIVNLIETAMDKTLWSESFGGKYNADNIFRIQSNIARNISNRLQVVLTPDEEQRIDQRFTDNSESLDLTLRGEEEKSMYWASRDNKHFESSLDYFNRALEVDPNNYRAALGKGNLYQMQFQRGYEVNKSSIDSVMSVIRYIDQAIGMNPNEPDGYMTKGRLFEWIFQFDSALVNYSKALELAPNMAAAQNAVGDIYYTHKEDIVNGLLYLSKALELNVAKNPRIYQTIGTCLMNTGFYERSKAFYKKAMEYGSPCGPMWMYSWIVIAVQEKYVEEAIFLDSLYEQNPECESNIMLYKIVNAVFSGDYKLGEQYYKEFTERGHKLDAMWDMTIVQIYLNTGRENEANRIIEESLSIYEKRIKIRGENWHDTLILSNLYTLKGEKEKALEFLVKAFDFGYLWGWQDIIEHHFLYKNLWGDPEFEAIVQGAKDEKAAVRAKILEMEERGEIDLSL
jgi:TolB-like protein/Tfp pilus assembly protein PilF